MTQHRIIHTESAPAAIGPYSQATAVTVGGGAREFLFVAGQIALDPVTGEVVDGTIEDQVHQIMRNIKAILAEAGSGFDRVVNTTIYLVDFGEFAACNEVYGSYFTGAPPARATVEVAALPKGVGVEIAVVAYT